MSHSERVSAANGLEKRPRDVIAEGDAPDLLDRWLAWSEELLGRDFFWKSEVDGALIGVGHWVAGKWTECDERAIAMYQRLLKARETARTPDLRP